MTKETWKTVAEDPIYEVSTLGRVRRNGDIIESKARGKYLVVSVGNASRPLHRVIMEAFVGKAPSHISVNHKDNNTRNNALSNLEYITNMGNIYHSINLRYPQPLYEWLYKEELLKTQDILSRYEPKVTRPYKRTSLKQRNRGNINKPPTISKEERLTQRYNKLLNEYLREQEHGKEIYAISISYRIERMEARHPFLRETRKIKNT